MLTHEQFIELALGGDSIRIAKNQAGDRRFIFRRSPRGQEREVIVRQDEYEILMQDVVVGLAERHLKRPCVEIKMDFYGNQWVELICGRLWQRRVRLGLSPRHINMLETAINEQQVALEPAD